MKGCAFTNVKVEQGSTFTITSYLPYISFTSFARIKLHAYTRENYATADFQILLSKKQNKVMFKEDHDKTRM